MFVSNIDFSLTEDDIRDVLGEVSDDTVQGTHATGKTGKTGKMAKKIPCQGKWPKKFPVRENTGNLEILPKHREFGLLKLYIP